MPLLTVLVLCGATRHSSAEPDRRPALTIEIIGAIPVSLDKVERALRATMGDLDVVDRASSSTAGAVARLRIAAMADGRIAVAYRDGGREDVEILDAGPEPAVRIARAVTRLRAELRRASRLARSRRPVRTRIASSPRFPAAIIRPKTAASAAPSAEPFLRLSVAAGLASRRLSIASDTAGQRRYVADGYALLAFELALSPARLVSARERSWLWLAIGGQLSPVMHTRKQDATTGRLVDVGGAQGELHATFQVDVHLSLNTISPHLGLAIGWSRLAFVFDRQQMERVGRTDQIPSVAYDGPLIAIELDAPLGSSGLIARCGLQGQWVTDLGRDALDVFGLRTGTGGEAHVGLSGPLLPFIDWKVGLSFRGVDMETRSFDRSSSTDHLVEGHVAVEYVP